MDIWTSFTWSKSSNILIFSENIGRNFRTFEDYGKEILSYLRGFLHLESS